MTSPAAPWQFEYAQSPTLPTMAWVATIRRHVVSVRCGLSVRIGERGFFEGTWAGPPRIESVAEQETTFGSGIVVSGRDLVVVPPAHTLEPVYHARDADGSLVVSNSFVALLVATGNQLRSDVLYPPLFGLINRGLSYATTGIPTAGEPVTVHYFENLVIDLDGSVSMRPKPRDKPFNDFAEYRDMLIERVSSSFANAPDYRPTVAMSTGYDSTAAGAIAARAGCDSVVSFRTGWPWAGYQGEDDRPDESARALGMGVEVFDRLGYMECLDAPEAEFLATGMSGEDVVYRSMDTALSRRILVTGFWGGAAWRGSARPNLSRVDLSGASLGEFGMRVDMIHLPLPYIGGLNQPNLAALRVSRDLKPYSVGGVYDEPFARRIAEEAGVPRNSFGQQKRATSQRIHTFGLDAMSESGRTSFEIFAGADAIANLPPKPGVRGRHRLAIKVAQAARADRLVAGLVETRQRSVHLEPVLGSLLLRWAVEEMRPRYAELEPITS